MYRDDEDIELANCELMTFVFYIRSIGRLEQDLHDIGLQLNTFGVSSPRIVSLEEAKYQKGTRIYSDAPLLQIFSEQAEMEEKIRSYKQFISRVCRKLGELKLNEHQLDLLYYRYEKAMTYDQIADRLGYSRQAIQWQLDLILKQFGAR